MSGFFSVFQDENIRRIMPKGKLFTVSCWFVHTKVLFVFIQLYAGAHVLMKKMDIIEYSTCTIYCCLCNFRFCCCKIITSQDYHYSWYHQTIIVLHIFKKDAKWIKFKVWCIKISNLINRFLLRETLEVERPLYWITSRTLQMWR